jgi:tetratricopeptide (TPR) repeat protein
MLIPKLPEQQKALQVRSEPVRVVFDDENPMAFSFVLAPQDDIAEIDTLRTGNLCLQDLVVNLTEKMSEGFRIEYDNLLAKAPVFEKSTTYKNRVANLEGILGNYEQEQRYLDSAYALSREPFFVHRKVESLYNQGAADTAHKVLQTLDLKADIYANLRTAALHVVGGDLTGAEEFVARAVHIDPMDFRCRLFEGALLLARGSYEMAIRSFRVASEERTTSSALHANLAIAYRRMHKVLKALRSAKRAVALDPLNTNSLMLLADLAFEHHRDEDALPSLMYFVEFEQKDERIWSRLARSLLRIGRPQECIQALKRQASLRDSSEVWNNLGIAYEMSGDSERGRRSFFRAMDLAEEAGHEYFLAARNLSQSLVNKDPHGELLPFVQGVLKLDLDGKVIRDRALSDLYVFEIHSLVKTGDEKAAESRLVELLSEHAIADNLAIWVSAALITNLALNDKAEKAVEIAKAYEGILTHAGDFDIYRKERFINNTAFALAELGQLAAAEQCLSKIQQSIHKEPYPTATLGLINFRRGHVERATRLYEEAVLLATARSDRVRIRQKLDLELGKYWSKVDPRKAVRSLSKVIGARGGEQALVRQAQTQLQALDKT